MNAAASNLKEALKDLTLRWEATKADWSDAKSQDFAKTYLEPLPEQIRLAMHQFDELEAILRRMKRECE